MQVTSLHDLHPGDHVSFGRRLHNQHVIVEDLHYDEGYVTIIEPGQFKKKQINFKDEKFKKVSHNLPLPSEKVIERAHSIDGEQAYKKSGCSSEKFANWCKEGDQVNDSTV